MRDHRPTFAIEQFEPRLLLSTYLLTGDSTATEGPTTPYTLTLTTSSTTVQSWKVNWGDGTALHPDVYMYSGSQLTQSHPYTVTGNFNISATIIDANVVHSASASVQVQPPDGESQLQVQGVPATMWRAVNGSSTPLATISDVYGDGDPSAYTATIDWGDGTNDSSGQVTSNPNGDGFAVVGSHAYVSAGNYQPTITVTHIADSNAAMVQTSVQVFGLQANARQGTSTDASEIDLTYSAAPGEQVQLEEAGPNDLNYHTIPGFTPTLSASAPSTANLTSLVPDSHYNFRLQIVGNGQIQDYPAFASTAASSATLTAPENLATGVANTSGQTPITLTWDPASDANAASGFTVFVRAYSSAEPFALYNLSVATQSFYIPSTNFTSGNQYTVLATLPANADQLEVQISDGTPTPISSWAPLQIIPTIAAPSVPALTLSDIENANNSVSFSLATGISGPFYGITTSNQLVNLNQLVNSGSGSSTLTIANSLIPTNLQEAIAFDGVNYSNAIAIPNVVPLTPVAPSNLTVVSTQVVGTQPQVTLAWDNNSNNESAYLLQRMDLSQAGSGWGNIPLAADQTSFTDTPPHPNDIYNYRVLAVNVGSVSAPSNVALVWFAPLVSSIGVNTHTAQAELPVSLSATAMPTGDNKGDSLTYTWSLVNLATPSTPITSLPTGPSVTFTPSTAGSYTATLTVTDLTLSLSTSVTSKPFIIGAAPDLLISGPAIVPTGQLTIFTAIGTGSANASWTATKGGTMLANGTGPTFSFVPEDGGAYVVQATETDLSNVTHTSSSNLTVTYVPPTLAISGPAIGFQGKSLTFASTLSQDSTANDTLTYTWTVLNADGSSGASTATSNLSTFVVPGSLAAGSYQAQLTLTDQHGGASIALVKTFSFSVLSDPSLKNIDVATMPFLNDTPDPVISPYVVLQQPDGKILLSASGEISGEGGSSFIERFNPDLSADTTFGPNHTGMINAHLYATLGSYAVSWLSHPGDSQILAMAFDPVDQDIVVVGNVWEADGASTSLIKPTLAVAKYVSADRMDDNGRLLEAGSLDPAFNGGQPLLLQAYGTAAIGTQLQVLADGSIVIAGNVQTWGPNSDASADIPISDFFLLKLQGDGEYYPGFGPLNNPPASVVAPSFAQAPHVNSVASAPFAAAPAGYEDISGWDGYGTSILDTPVQSLTVMDDGTLNEKILVGGSVTRQAVDADGIPIDGVTDTGFEFVRYNPNGMIDTTFGDGGKIFTSSTLFNSSNGTPANGFAYLTTVKSLSNGTFIAAGVAETSGNSGSIVFAQYLANGTLDPSYGTNGVRNTEIIDYPDTNLGLNAEKVNTLPFTIPLPPGNGEFTFQTDGKLVASLFTDPPSPGVPSDWKLIRINSSDGSVDSSFANEGTIDPVTPTPSWTYVTGDRPQSIAIASDGSVIAGGALFDEGSSSTMPMLVRYRSLPASAASNLTLQATPSNNVYLTWNDTANAQNNVPVGYGQVGFQIRRATVQSDLSLASSLIGTVGADQTDFVDRGISPHSISPDSTYFYEVVPFTTDNSGNEQTGVATTASVHTLPIQSNNVLVETINVPLNGTSILSNTTLQSGKTYLLVARGSITLGSALGLSVQGDGAYWYVPTDAKSFGNAFANQPFGVGIAAGLSSPIQTPDWGTYDSVEHTYTLAITGQGTPLAVALQDTGFAGTSITAGTQPLQLQVYAVNPTAMTLPTNTPSVMQIGGFGSLTGTAAVIQQNTSVSIIAANPDGTVVPWSLWLVSSSGARTLLTSGEQSVGQLPSAPAPVTTIDPALYSNGLYTLQLVDSLGAVRDQRSLAIDTAVKAGNFHLPVTDATLNTLVGPIAITRSYDSSLTSSQSDFGPGWRFDLLNAQLSTSAQADTFDPTNPAVPLRTGDLVYLTVPNDGAHVFEFVPTPLVTGIADQGGISTVEYVPEFVAVDGSGATLTLKYNIVSRGNFNVPTDNYHNNRLIYDKADNEFLAYTNLKYHDTNIANHYQAFSPSANPYANPVYAPFSDVYELTTKDGTSYAIDAGTGQIQSVTNPNGSTISYTVNSDGSFTANLTTDGTPKLLFSGTTGANKQITSINVPGQAPINYSYDSSGNLSSVESPTGDTTYYAYQDPNNPNLLTGVTNAVGQTTLQAQYDDSGELSAIINSEGTTIPVTAFNWGANEVAQTVVDAAGDISQDIYDERFGTLLRKIQTVTDDAGNVLDYIVTVNDFSYVTDDMTVMSDLSASGVQMPQTMRTFAPFEVAGTDAAGLRYSQLPGANSWTQLVTFDTSTNVDDYGSGQPVLLSKRLTASGNLQTTAFGNYAFVEPTLDLSKPQLITTEIQTSDAASLTGYDDQTQSTIYTLYDANGRIIHSLVAMGSDPANPGHILASGTLNTYGGPVNALTETQSLTTSTIGAPTAADDSPDPAAAKTQNVYYPFSDITIPKYQVGIPGAVWGGVQYSVDTAGQETYYAYDSEGHPLLTYMYKQWTNSSGGTVFGWVGTTTVYNSIGLVTDTYQATYIDSTPTANRDGQYHILITAPGGPAGVTVGSNYGTAASMVLTNHNDYNTLGQKIDSIDQYGGVTRFTYDAYGRLIRTANPNGTETRSVYDALGRAIWTTTQPFVPANSDLSNATNTAVLTHTIYNQLGQVVETDQYQGGVIEIVTENTGSSVVWTSQEVGGSLLSFTKTFYDPAGNAIETQSTADSGAVLRVGTIYYPDGQVEYSGVLTASAPDGGHTQTVNGITTSEYQLSDFASYSQTLYNQYNSTVSLFYTRVIDQNGHQTDTYKDALGRTVRTVYDDGSFTETLYSAGTQVVTAARNSNGTLVAIGLPNGWTNILPGGYEEVQIAQRKSGDSLVITYYLYNAAGQLTDVWQPAVTDGDPASLTHGQSVTPHSVYTYDTAGNNLAQTDPKGNATTFSYDQNGNQVSQTLPLAQAAPGSASESWTYNASGQVLTHVDFKGQTTVYTYDDSASGQGRPLAKYIFAAGVAPFDGSGNILTTLAAQATTIFYNALGLRSEVDDYVNGALSRQTTYTYDPLSEQLASTTTPEGTINYAYNAIGEEIDTSTANTDTGYHYDAQGRLRTVTVTKLNGNTLATPQVTTYGYDAVGNKISEVLPNGVTTAYTYDDLNRLTNIVEKNSANVTLFSEIYTLNSDGTRALATERQVQPDGSFLMIVTTWTYDAMDRLRGEAVTSAFTAAPNEAAPPNGLAGWLTLPAADADWGNQNPAGIDVVLVWNGNAYVSPGLMVDDVRYANTQGAALVPPAAAVRYGGNGTDWLLMTSDGGSGGGIANFTFSQGVLTVDGNGVLRVDGGAGDPNYGWASITIGNAAPSYTDTFSYDPASNRMKKIHIGPGGGPSEIITYTYNSDNELTKQVSTLAGETDFTYDPNGSLITQVSHAPTYSVHLDGSFGSSGMVAPEGDNATIYAQTVLANGKILASGCVTDSNNNPFISLFEFNADGSRNTAFGSGGMVNTSIMGISTAVSVLANGDIVLLGSAYADGVTTTTDSIVLAEFHANGTANASFGTDGSGIMLVPAADGTYGMAMSVLSNGTIVVAGIGWGGVLLEFNANGTPNTSFGTNGVAPDSTGTGWNLLSVLSNGNLLVAGGSSMSEYDAFGHLVRSFGTNGIASLGNLSEGALTVLSNGQILVGGTLTTSGAGGYISELAVEKFNADGTLDTSFGAGGMAVSTSELGAYGPGYVLSALPSGDILVGGSALDANVNMYLVLGEFRSDGSVEGSFGSGGVMLASMGGYDIQAEAATLLPDGEILLGGWMDTTLTNNLFLAKYQVDSVPAGYGTANQTTTYTYDVKGKLVSVSTNGHVNATYTYDDAGNRVSETVGGVTTLYLTDTQNPTGYAQPLEAKSTATGKPITMWILGDRVFGQADTNGAMTYLLTDGHGSTRLLTNASGTVTAAFNYDAFGTATNFNAGMAATPFLFGGDAFYDPASGLYIHGDGTRERNGFWFIESDFGVKGRGNKNDPLSLHKYLYVWGDPINGHDPSGHDLVDGLTQAGSLVAGTIGDAIGFGGYDVAMAFWGGAWEGSQAGGMAFADNFTFHQIGWLHDGRTAYWQQQGLAGTGIETATDAAAWAATAAIDSALVLGAWGFLDLPTFNVAAGPGGAGFPFHITYGANGAWMEATGLNYGAMSILEASETNIAAQWWWATLTGIPVLSVEGVMAGGSAFSCLTAAIWAYLNGWTPMTDWFL